MEMRIGQARPREPLYLLYFELFLTLLKITLVAHIVSVEHNESYSVYILDNTTGSCQARDWCVPLLRYQDEIE